MTAQNSDFDVDESTRFRNLSRSPRPYRRTQSPHTEPEPVGIRRWSIREMAAEAEGTQLVGGGSDKRTISWVTPSPPSQTPIFTPSSTALSLRSPGAVAWAMRNQGPSLGSESGTEADDELPKKLPAPPRKNRNKGLGGWSRRRGKEEEKKDCIREKICGDCVDGGCSRDLPSGEEKGWRRGEELGGGLWGVWDR
ncbi:hypothetical protein L211DRAFT_205111 [Terfezia boudieri ATCC MYA-4762]|uniref:Uncharacterized protein n=1 Tax=Terfezia boudieri ATCC MYA-4762 TaxID=1051890 RepID=A0A3N4M195_9PEZI|nr:hypothetical protein L211DRAFT_205111 [Terfezia boudieri ATCC MYA-4762]